MIYREGFDKKFPHKNIEKDTAEQIGNDREEDYENDELNLVEDSYEIIEDETLANKMSEEQIKTDMSLQFSTRLERQKSRTTRFLSSNYNIRNELGPRNYIDKLIAWGQVVGNKFGDRQLTIMGRQLAELADSIPYDHDHFYRVREVAEKIRLRIGELALARRFERDRFTKRDSNGENIYFTFEIIGNSSNEKTFKIKIYTACIEGKRRGNLHAEAIKKIEEELGFGELDSLQCEEDRIDYDRGAYADIRRYMYDDQIVYVEDIWNHENGEDFGFRDIFYIDNLQLAVKVWRKLKG